jgi:uncharacterized phage protein (TIGR01671 family)
MNREIKFRAWDKKAQVMLPVEQWANKSWIAVPIQVGAEEWELNQLKMEDIELMQYTGLKDKNGKEIYDRDIVKMKSYSDDQLVVFDEMTMTGCGCHNGYGYELPQENNDPDEWEIIGNIYENPELLA